MQYKEAYERKSLYMEKVQENEENVEILSGKCCTDNPKTSVEPVVKAQDDESVIKNILKTPRNMAYISAVKKGDEMTEQDFEIIDMVQQRIEEQQEKLVTTEKVDKLLYILSKCYIDGCEVHTLTGEFIHYGSCVHGVDLATFSAMPERMRKGYDVYRKYPDCLSVEIYEHHICVVGYSGKTTVIDEE